LQQGGGESFVMPALVAGIHASLSFLVITGPPPISIDVISAAMLFSSCPVLCRASTPVLARVLYFPPDRDILAAGASMSESRKIETLVEGLTFPEGPRWHDGKLWFSDFYTHRVLRAGLDGHLETVAAVPHQPSGLGWMPNGDLLIVSMLDRQLLRLAGSRLEIFADLSEVATFHCNDMVVDRAGRAYVGNFGFDLHAGATPSPAALARVEPDGRVFPAASGLMFPNGMVITPDAKTLVIAETFANRLSAFDVDAAGNLKNRRVFAELPGIFPDGICLDAEGAVWVADARGMQVVRVFDGGRIERTVATGERRVYACMLGGEARRTLFLCTSSGSGPEMTKKRDGKIEFVEVDAPGAGLP
jgi:sugar lactone lactonase YvrE